MWNKAIIILSAILPISFPGWAAERDPAVPRAFQRDNPCPSTGRTSGPCPGYERDHIMALCLNGADHPANLQWLAIEEHRAKTKGDIQACRSKRNGEDTPTGAPF